ncbi:hypothetical protein [Bellilinea sp.]|uniref:hypothetical protein n=1 Tax=Bellilinea sp. TaxID=2838785 RepID=UPI002ADDB7B2|nr:hypothetical protein [Bellilinea sp.]
MPGNGLAEQIAEKRIANMVFRSELLFNLPVLPLEVIEVSLKTHLPIHHQCFLLDNLVVSHSE